MTIWCKMWNEHAKDQSCIQHYLHSVKSGIYMENHSHRSLNSLHIATKKPITEARHKFSSITVVFALPSREKYENNSGRLLTLGKRWRTNMAAATFTFYQLTARV